MLVISFIIFENYVVIRQVTKQKVKFSVRIFFSKGDQIRSFLRIWLHLLKKSSMKNFIFCTVTVKKCNVDLNIIHF